MIKEIKLDKSANQHLYVQLYNQLKKLIQQKELEVHSKLPSIRKLAKQLEVNNVTIVNAYNLLEEEELVYKKVGSGTFVAPLTKEQEATYLDEKIYIDEDTKFIKEKEIINFATAAPTPDLFPIKPFQKLLNKVLERDGGYAFGYQKSQGYLPLRKSLSQYITNYQINASVSEIQIISGAQQGIDILAKTFLNYGDTVFVERPTYPGAISVFKSRHAQITEIPIKEDGIDLKVLEEKLKAEQPKFIYLMPNFQNPTGYSYSREKKEKILKLANQYDLLIIEDDCLSDLNYTKKSNLSLKAMDTTDRVIYIKSFSKIFMPGLRLAFLIIPDCYFDDILLSKYISDIFTDGLVQRVLDLYFREEVWEKQINKLKETYQYRYQTMIKALTNYLPPECNFSSPQGGLNLWVQLPQGVTAHELYEQTFEAGVNIAPGSVFYHSNPQEDKIRLSIAAVTNQEIKTGINKLGRLIKKELNKGKQDWDNSWMPLV